MRPQFTPLLVDANQGAKILGISLSHFYVFMRKNKTIRPVAVGSLKMWRRKDLSRLTGKPCDQQPGSAEDILIDVVEIGALCSISRSLVYKLNDLEMMPEPILDGRTLRWSLQEIREWVDMGCPKRGEEITVDRATTKTARPESKREAEK